MSIQPNLTLGIEALKKAIEEIPYTSGIYKMIDEDGGIIYIGKAKRLPNRLNSYTRISTLPNRLRRMVSLVRKVEVLTTSNEAQALLLEANLIKSIRPKFNIALKDDKSFPYIMIESDHPFPRITKYRGKKLKGHIYFGPFASAGNVDRMIVELQKLFLLRPCTNTYFANRTQPCLQYQIKRCSAPCVGKISQASYAESIRQIQDFLSGKSTDLQQRFIKLMNEAGDKLEYEKAAEYRDKLKLLNQIQAKNLLRSDNTSDVDIFALKYNDAMTCIQVFFIRNGYNFGNKVYFPDFQNGTDPEEALPLFIANFYRNNLAPKEIWVNTGSDNLKLLKHAIEELSGHKVKVVNPTSGSSKYLMDFALDNAMQALGRKTKDITDKIKSLEQVRQLFKLNKPIQRIEAYDNSHNYGSYPVGCMIVATPQGFAKKEYRTFIIKSLKDHKIDDYAMLEEVLKRRLNRLDESNYPDILLIDGGKGQLTIAEKVLDEMNISDIKLVCIAKGPDRNAANEVFFTRDQAPIQLPRRDNTLDYLRGVRDEVHRFAIEFHRRRRGKAIHKSSIDDIPGIGGHRKKMLLSFFGSVEIIAQANVQELCKVQGISKKIAQQVYDYLHY